MSVFELVARAVGLERAPAAKAAAQVVETPYAWPAWRQGQPDWTSPTLQGFAEAGYGDNAIVCACIARRSQSAALAPLVAYTGERTKPTRLPDAHPLAALLLRPNPWQSWYEFMELLITYLDLDGNAFVYKAGPSTALRSAQGAVKGLFPLRSDRVRPVPGLGRTDPLLGYVYDSADSGFFEREPFLPEEIIHVKFPNPGDPFEGLGRGTSRLAAAAKSTDVDNAATSFLKTFFDQAVVPFGLLKSKQKMLDSEVIRVRERLRAQYGGAQNWGDVMILDADAEYQRLGLSMQEMTFGDLDARNEARICMVLEVPPIIVGAKVGLDRSTFANYGEARSSFWEDSLIPGIYRRFEDAFNGGLAGDGVWLAYDYSAVPALREDQTAKWESAARAFMGGFATRNEARAIVDLAPVPAAQDGFRRADEQRIGQPGLTQTPNAVGDGTAELDAGTRGDGDAGKDVDGGDEYGLPFGIRSSFDCGLRAGGPRPYGQDDKQAGGDEARLTERLKIEATGTRRIARALRSQLALAAPAGATAETLMGAEERMRRGSQALQDECYRMMREAALLGIEAAQTGVEGMWGKSLSHEGLSHEKADGIGIDWSLVNADVLRWLDGYAFDLVRSVDANSARALREAISRWAQNGLPLPDLIKELGPIFGTKRAAVIAATEVTRAFAEANLRAWKASGVVSQVGFRTANDERVCPVCAPLGGLTFGDEAQPGRIEDQERRAAVRGIDDVFVHPGGAGQAERYRGQEFRAPPLHPRCRCWLVPIG
jgi:HK97 family phage portal protein